MIDETIDEVIDEMIDELIDEIIDDTYCKVNINTQSKLLSIVLVKIS